jgi:hypothetical protein
MLAKLQHDRPGRTNHTIVRKYGRNRETTAQLRQSGHLRRTHPTQSPGGRGSLNTSTIDSTPTVVSTNFRTNYNECGGKLGELARRPESIQTTRFEDEHRGTDEAIL